jgi:hypothetical protein
MLNMKRQTFNQLLAPTHISLQDQKKLLELLIEIEELFDGTLGGWKTNPVSFEL